MQHKFLLCSTLVICVYIYIWLFKKKNNKKGVNKKKQVCCPIEHKSKVSKPAVLKKSLAVNYIVLYTCRLVLFSHFNNTKIFNGYILFQEYIPFKFVC